MFIIFYVTLFTAFGLTGQLNSNDNTEHFKMSQDSTYNIDYRSWYRLITPITNQNSFIWFILPIIITIGITTYFIYQLGGFWAATVLFASTYFFSILGAGLYPQALATMLLLGFFVYDNKIIKIIFLALLWYSHSTGQLLVLSIIGLTLIFMAWKYLKNSKLALVCSPIFGTKGPKFLETNVNFQPETSNWALSLGDLLSFGIKGFSFPFIIFGLKGLLNNKEYLFLGLLLIILIGAFVQNSRVLLLAIPFLCIGFGQEWIHLKYKKLWIGFIILMSAYQWLQFVLLRIVC